MVEGQVYVYKSRRLPTTCCGCLDLRTGCVVIAAALIIIELIGSVGTVVGIRALDIDLDDEAAENDATEPAETLPGRPVGGDTAVSWEPPGFEQKVLDEGRHRLLVKIPREQSEMLSSPGRLRGLIPTMLNPHDVVFVVEEHRTERSAEVMYTEHEMSALSAYTLRGVLICAAVLVTITIACNISLLVGVFRNSSPCVLVWLIWHGVVFLVSTGGAVFSAYQHATDGQRCDLASGQGSPGQVPESPMGVTEAVGRASCPSTDGVLTGLLVAASFAMVVFYWYCFVVVLAFYMQLKREVIRKSIA